MFFKKIKICTHDGKFHADDVFSVATLDLFFDGKIKVVRSRKPEDISSADIVVDNGREYSPEKKIFDHHQSGGAGERESGIPYAGFGLIWKHYGLELCKKFNSDEKVWQMIDADFVAQIDATDNGYVDFYNEKINQSAVVADKYVSYFMTTWREDISDIDKNFLKCVSVAKEILKRLIVVGKDKIDGMNFVRLAYENADDKRIIFIDKFYYWSFLSELPEPEFIIYPDVNTNRIKIQAVPIKTGSMEVRNRFPVEWGGLVDNELEKISGIKGMCFCHNAGFLCVVKDIQTATEVLNKLLK